MLLGFSFPKFGHPAFGWVALAPLLAVAWDCGRSHTWRRAFLLGWIAGLTHFAVALYWLVGVMTHYGGLSTPVAVLVGALLMAYLALFVGLATWIVAAGVPRFGAHALLLAPAAWVSGELGRTYVWSGFPWALLGYSQVTLLPIAQTASLVGVYGLSMLLALTSGALAYALVAERRRFLPFASVLVVIVVLAIWGTWRIREGSLTRRGTPIRVGVVQGSISQDEKWNSALEGAIMRRYIDLSRAALAQNAQFILWPESSLPFYFELNPVGVEPIRRLAREGGAAFLIGSDQLEQVRLVPGQPPPEERARYYNAAFLVQPDGRTGAVYRKMHLVPFGEYVPLKNLLFFVGPLVEAVSDFSPGDEQATLPVAGHVASTAICYEVVYPQLIAGFVDRGSELLTTITNDAWFGTSSAAYQHWDQAAMRSIEQGRYLARAANTGISGFVDPYGRELAKTALFEPAVQVREVRFLTERTVYGHIGDSVAYAGLVIAMLIVVGSGRRFRQLVPTGRSDGRFRR